jgi:hypothetical protein
MRPESAISACGSWDGPVQTEKTNHPTKQPINQPTNRPTNQTGRHAGQLAASSISKAAGKCDFCHFFGAPTSKNNEKSISRIIDFCLSSTFLRDFYRVRKIDRTFDLSSKHRFRFYGIRGNMYAYIVVTYVYPIILIVSSPGLQCRSSMNDILPFSLPSENLENDAF